MLEESPRVALGRPFGVPRLTCDDMKQRSVKQSPRLILVQMVILDVTSLVSYWKAVRIPWFVVSPARTLGL